MSAIYGILPVLLALTIRTVSMLNLGNDGPLSPEPAPREDAPKGETPQAQMTSRQERTSRALRLVGQLVGYLAIIAGGIWTLFETGKIPPAV